MHSLRQTSRKPHATLRRQGATTVEFALCAPIFFLLFFLGLEVAGANLIVQTTKAAALHAARRGIIPGATVEDVRETAQEALRAALISDFEIRIDPPVIADDTKSISVDIEVPVRGNGFIAHNFFSSTVVRRSATLRREE